MKRLFLLFVIAALLVALCSCSKGELAELTTEVNDDYAAILWGDKTYVPYCAIAKSDCGKQIGIVDGNKNDRVYEYQGHSADEWLINCLTTDGGALLYKEIDVVAIPEGLQSEYPWNDESQ